MVSREQKRAILHEKLQVLRSVTHSHAGNKMSIIVDASTYIKELKQKIGKLNQEIASAEHTPLVSVEVLEKGFLINVFVEKSSPGLLASILEAFDGLGLTVLEARASCAGSFRLEAVGGEDEDEARIDADVVEQAVVQAIKNCPLN
uniref:Plant bHLH transcription factor ACT-like domain-containing protein n=1 Tax=Arundo donax TaxID=35708 RepID=A0A0A9H1U6_ARUDO